MQGIHTTVICVLLSSLFLSLGFWRRQAFYLTIVGLLFFVLLTGAHASTVRAALMTGMVLLAQIIGRLTRPRQVISLTAFLMLVKDPSLLFHHIGFQLSFLAVIGIVYLSPYLKEKLRWLPEIIVVSLSTQIAVLPLIFYYFKQLSLIAPLANLLVLPLLPFIMLIGFATVLIGAISTHLGIFFAWPVWFLLTYLIKIVELLARIPFACLSV